MHSSCCDMNGNSSVNMHYSKTTNFYSIWRNKKTNVKGKEVKGYKHAKVHVKKTLQRKEIYNFMSKIQLKGKKKNLIYLLQFSNYKYIFLIIYE